MQIEVVTDDSGTIIASCVQDDRTATRQGMVDDGSRAAPGTILRARSGQFRHVITVPAELEAMPLKQLHKSCRVVVEGGKGRLERMQQ